MKKLNHRPSEPELFIEALDAIPDLTIFAQKEGKVVGMIENYGVNGTYLKLYPNKFEYYDTNVQGTIAKAEKDGYEFYVNE